MNGDKSLELSLFSSHRKKNCEYLHLIKKNSQRANRNCEFFLIRCKHSQRAANKFLRWLEKRLYGPLVLGYRIRVRIRKLSIFEYSFNFKTSLIRVCMHGADTAELRHIYCLDNWKVLKTPCVLILKHMEFWCEHDDFYSKQNDKKS